MISFEFQGSIESGLFKKFACLKKLNLKNNKILRFYPNTFKECACLTYLDLSYNRLSQLLQGDFDGAENLKSIFLNNNILQHVSSDTFQKQTQITEYSFANNPVSVFFTLTLTNGILTTTVNNQA